MREGRQIKINITFEFNHIIDHLKYL